MTAPSFFLLKIESLRTRARMLPKLRETLALPADRDIRPEQWEVLSNQLATVANRLLHQLRVYTDQHLSDRNEPRMRQALIQRLGELELELSQAYNFYDTYMDVLTQRLSDPIGSLLRGCDAIAADGLRRGFLAEITVPPVVYCERGFGASTLREGVDLQRNVPNPIPFIAIPYARIAEKYNLISIYHEVGHQTLVKLNLLPVLQRVFHESASQAGASTLLSSLFANWSKELGPDFWAFCLTGMAQTCSIRDVLVLPGSAMFQISPFQQHPPAYLRFLMSVEWCKHLWGKGDWDQWEAEWTDLYPTRGLDSTTREAIESARKFMPAVARALLNTRFKKFDNKPISSLFALDELQPARLKSLATIEAVTAPGFRQRPIGVQLAAFRMLREKRVQKLADTDKLMSLWLKNLPNA